MQSSDIAVLVRRHLGLIPVVLGLFFAVHPPAVAQLPYLSYGKFFGSVSTEWLDDGRKMRLLAPFTYLDPKGMEWQAPVGWVVDGASIPKFAWSIIGGPFEGKYRNASVIHDVACDQRQRPWEAVHEAFYYAMRAGGVAARRAQVMYGAVYHFGPRWGSKVNIAAIPRSGVDRAVDEVRAGVDRNSRFDVAIRPRPRSTDEIRTNQPETVDLTVDVTPPAPSAQQERFGKLKAEIEGREPARPTGMTLEEIRTFKLDD